MLFQTMKKVLFLVVLVMFISCCPEQPLFEKLEQDKAVATECCGEVGQLPDEPEDD